jgi:alpha-L-fucosidase 2
MKQPLRTTSLGMFSNLAKNASLPSPTALGSLILSLSISPGLFAAPQSESSNGDDGFRQYNELIWQTKPGDLSRNWEEQVFLLGNSYFGVSCYGGTARETFTMSEKSFWTGGPGDSKDYNYGVIPVRDRSAIEKIKELSALGDFHGAERLVAQTHTSHHNYGALSTIGNLVFDFDGHDKEVSNYTRALNLRNSRVDIDYQIGETQYKREYFCSYPDRLLGIRLTANGPEKLNFQLSMELMHKKAPAALNIDADSGLYEVAARMDDNNRPYRVKIKVQNTDGSISSDGATLVVNDCSEVVIYYTVATNYKADSPPLYKGEDPVAITDAVISSIQNTSFDELLARHTKDYQNLYLRTSLKLSSDVKPFRVALPTNERLNYYIENKSYEDIGLKELAFNFGKYVLISASRPGTLPAGLQGPWNAYYKAPWNGVYQLDMNVTQTYMYGNALNLSECQEPFLDFSMRHAELGKSFAKEYFDCGGWASLLLTDIWNHVGILHSTELKFVSTGWLALILWEQYEFDQDKEYLKEIYPVLKGAAEFYQANLVDYKNSGQLVFVGSASAEHRASIGAFVPNFQDLAFARDSFSNAIEAAEILDVDSKYRTELTSTRERLMPFKIGKWGQLQEWVEDVDDPRCQHRHIAHLVALQPSKLINPRTMPELAEACRVTLEHRGDADFVALFGVGGNNSPDFPSTCTHEGFHYDKFTSHVWCRAARMSLWLRLFDGDRADKIYNDIFRESTLENMIQFETKMHYPDSAATPFFLEGMVLSAGYVTEMVLQSQNDELELLPALPSSWHTGSLTGIRGRGGYTVNVRWKDGQLENAVISADRSSNCKIRYNGKVEDVFISDKTPYVIGG